MLFIISSLVLGKSILLLWLLLDVISQLNYRQDNNYFTCLILLDLKKAFDTVDHELSLSKLEK